MEHHRLKPMNEGYDRRLFEEIYKKTTPLRRKLAYEIDARKFGVDYDEILSWFDVKFIHSFNKFGRTFDTSKIENPEGKLLGYIINALSTYKYRIMRSSYQAKYHNHANTVDITTLFNYENMQDEGLNHNSIALEEHMEAVMGFMKKHLSGDALLVLDIQLNPPLFITSKLQEMGKKDISKIPAELVADYLGLPADSDGINYINNIRKNIRRVITKARDFFTNHPVELSLN